MAWVVGIDEAGYGPNLGPFVQSAVALRLPEGDPAGWETLKRVVRRSHEKPDGRVLIDDSKKVYARGGLAALERSVRTAFSFEHATVGDLFRHTTLAGIWEELAEESWFDADETAPVSPGEANHTVRLDELGETTRTSIPAASVVPPTRFNRICDESGTKATVLARGLVELVQAVLGKLGAGDEPVAFHCDKQGGRNFYASILQEAFPDGWVVAEKEAAAESRYRVDLLERPVTITFRPRAEADSIAVALASMLCKYLREVCMRQFNRFWQGHVPGLLPTAGYPADARRFYEAIHPCFQQLGLNEEQVWRKK
jgi:ribonuclease HII